MRESDKGKDSDSFRQRFADRLAGRLETSSDEMPALARDLYKNSVVGLSKLLGGEVINDVKGAYPDLSSIPGLEFYSTRALANAMIINMEGGATIYLPYSDDVKDALDYFRENNLARRGLRVKFVTEQESKKLSKSAIKAILKKAQEKAKDESGRVDEDKLLEHLKSTRITFFGESPLVHEQVQEALKESGLPQNLLQEIEEIIFPNKEATNVVGKESINDKVNFKTLLDRYFLGEKKEKYTTDWILAEEFLILPSERQKGFLFGSKKVYVKPRNSASGVGQKSFDMQDDPEKSLSDLNLYLEELKRNGIISEYYLEHQAPGCDFEISLQFLVEGQNGERASLPLAVTRQLVNDAGVHQGNIISFDPEFLKAHAVSKEMVDDITGFVEFGARESGYQGYASLDIMVGTEKDTYTLIDPNFRLTGVTFPLSILTYLQAMCKQKLYIMSTNTIAINKEKLGEPSFSDVLDILEEENILFKKDIPLSEGPKVIPYLIATPDKLGILVVGAKQNGLDPGQVSLTLQALSERVRLLLS